MNPADDSIEIDVLPLAASESIEQSLEFIRNLNSKVRIPAKISKLVLNDDGEPTDKYIVDLYEAGYNFDPNKADVPTRREVDCYNTKAGEEFQVGANVLVSLTDLGIAIILPREIPQGKKKWTVLTVIDDFGNSTFDYQRFNE